MKVLLDAILAVTLASEAVLFGAQTYIRVDIVPAVSSAGDQLALRLHQELLTWRTGKVMKPAGFTAITALTALFVVVPFVSESRKLATLVLVGCAFLALLGYFRIAQKERRVNRTVNTWSPEAPPEDYGEVWAEWDAMQRYRLGLTALAFALTVAAVMVNT
jgi:Domain of unknown function (DUF1772)